MRNVPQKINSQPLMLFPPRKAKGYVRVGREHHNTDGCVCSSVFLFIVLIPIRATESKLFVPNNRVGGVALT